MIFLLFLIVPVLCIFLYRIKRRKMYKMAAVLPGTREDLPIIGIAHTLIGDTEDIMNSLQIFSYESMEQNGLVKGWLNHILYFILVNPMDVEWVLKNCLEKDDLHRFIRKIIGYGGIFAPVPIWRRRRKILIPAFSPKILESFVDILSEQSEKLAKRLKSTANGRPFSVWPYLSSYTLDSVCETAMGVSLNTQDNPDSKFLASLNTLLNLTCKRIFHLWLQPDSLFKLFPDYQEHKKCVKIMHDFTDEVIAKRREELVIEKKNKSEADNEYDLQSYGRKSFLDLLISLSGGEKGYTNIELREEVLTLVVAGMDTSAVTIGYVLKLMAKYPEVQQKVYQELYDVYGDSDRQLVKDDLVKLVYLERVVKETLRLFPAVPFIIRKVLEDIELPSGRQLPAGSGIVISIWGIHRDPKYWGPNAEHFDPDRFLPERMNLEHPCSFMPFSNGPRNCVGYRYAMMSVKTSLATLLRRYEVIGVPETGPIPRIRVKLDIMMKAVDGYQIALKERKHK